MILNEQALLPNLFQAPPDGFHILWRHSPICLIEINPETHSLCHLRKCIYMAGNRFTTLVIKWCDSIFFNVAFSGESKFFLYCNFNWQAMTIPPCFSSDVLSFHSLITRKDIFKYTRFNMVSSRHAICCRWTLIKSPRRLPSS